MTPTQEFCDLGWRIIEWKLAYYKPEFVHSSRRADYTIEDDTYDAHELRYLTLCRELKRRNYNVHKVYPGFEDLVGPHTMMEVDMSRPSVQLVAEKLSKPKLKPKATPGG